MVPKFLFESEFSNLTNDARMLYGLLLSGYEKSINNKQYDSNGYLYVYCKRKSMENFLQLSDKTVQKLVADLKGHNLLEEIRRGLSKPNRIYLQYITKGQLVGQTGKNSDSRPEDFPVQEQKVLRLKTGNISGSRPELSPVQEQEYLRFMTGKNSGSRAEDFPVQEQKVLPVKTGNISDSRPGEFTIQWREQEYGADYIELVNKTSKIKIEKSEIMAVRFDSARMVLFLEDKELVLGLCKQSQMSLLLGDDFIVCSKDYLINKNHVEQVNFRDRKIKLKDKNNELIHNIATRCLESGIEMRVVQEFLGHSSINMTADIYTHVLPEKKQESIIKMEDNFKRKCQTAKDKIKGKKP